MHSDIPILITHPSIQDKRQHMENRSNRIHSLIPNSSTLVPYLPLPKSPYLLTCLSHISTISPSSLLLPTLRSRKYLGTLYIGGLINLLRPHITPVHPETAPPPLPANVSLTNNTRSIQKPLTYFNTINPALKSIPF